MQIFFTKYVYLNDTLAHLLPTAVGLCRSRLHDCTMLSMKMKKKTPQKNRKKEKKRKLVLQKY